MQSLVSLVFSLVRVLVQCVRQQIHFRVLLLQMQLELVGQLEDECSECEVDAEKVFAILTNLIKNAIKYSDDKKVTIKSNDKDEIIFENRGEGLKYPLEKYFEPFFANESKSKNRFGLGLYIVNSILKANNCILKYEYKDGINIFIIAKKEQKDT